MIVAALPAMRATRWRVVLLLLAALVLLALRVFVVSPLRVDGDSMAPTLRSGDVAVVLKFGAPHAGQVVSLRDPQDGSLVVRRMVALGGQTVEIRDAYLYVDGVEVDEPFVDHSRIDGVYFGPVSPGRRRLRARRLPQRLDRLPDLRRGAGRVGDRAGAGAAVATGALSRR